MLSPVYLRKAWLQPMHGLAYEMVCLRIVEAIDPEISRDNPSRNYQMVDILNLQQKWLVISAPIQAF
jgi:hypothetical protein